MGASQPHRQVLGPKCNIRRHATNSYLSGAHIHIWGSAVHVRIARIVEEARIGIPHGQRIFIIPSIWIPQQNKSYVADFEKGSADGKDFVPVDVRVLKMRTAFVVAPNFARILACGARTRMIDEQHPCKYFPIVEGPGMKRRARRGTVNTRTRRCSPG